MDARGRDLAGISFAVHTRTKEELKARLASQGLAMRDLFLAAIDAYLNGHAAQVAILEQWVRSDRTKASKKRSFEEHDLNEIERKKIRDEIYDEGPGEW